MINVVFIRISLFYLFLKKEYDSENVEKESTYRKRIKRSS